MTRRSTEIPSWPPERAVEKVDAGIHRREVRPGRPLHRRSTADSRPSRHSSDQRRSCVLIRDAVGSRADLLFGTHGQFTASGAIRLARRLEPYDPLWFEEPTPPENPAEMARVATGTSIPIATGERLTTMYEFARVLEAGAASILQPATGRCGGVLDAKKIAAIAETHYALVAPHLYCGPIEAAANIAVAPRPSRTS